MELQNVTIGLLAIAIIGIGYLIKEVIALKSQLKNFKGDTTNLQLQAYERLTVFAERCGLKSLVSRADAYGQSAAVMHGVLLENIKSEYEYNVSQQVYVSPEIWEAVTKLKDQNIYIINQLAGGLLSSATSLDLSKRILEYSMMQNGELNLVVLDAIQHEAKKIVNG